MARIAKPFNLNESFLSVSTLNNNERNDREERYRLKGCKAVSSLDSFQRLISYRCYENLLVSHDNVL